MIGSALCFKSSGKMESLALSTCIVSFEIQVYISSIWLSLRMLDSIIIEIRIIKCFIFITPLAEVAQGLVAQRMFLKACCMQGILGSKIQHKVFNHFVIGMVKNLLNDKRPNDYVYWCIRS